MKKSTRNIIMGIGIVSILAGLYSWYNQAETFQILLSITIGISLIGKAYLEKPN